MHYKLQNASGSPSTRVALHT